MRIHSVTTAGATTAIALTTVWGTRTTTTTSHLLLFTVLENCSKKYGSYEPGQKNSYETPVASHTSTFSAPLSKCSVVICTEDGTYGNINQFIMSIRQLIKNPSALIQNSQIYRVTPKRQ